MYWYIKLNVFKVIYIDNILTTLQSKDIWDHVGVFTVNLKRIRPIDI